MDKMKEFSVSGIDQLPNTADPDYYKFVLDRSGSMDIYEREVEESLKNYKTELLKIDEASSIFISRADFAEYYKETPYDSVENLSTSYSACGGTHLYTAIVRSVQSTITAQEKLIEEAYEPRMTVIILSDGQEWSHGEAKYGFSSAKEYVEKAISRGITMVFVDFGGKNGSIPKQLGFQSIYSCEDSADALNDTFKKITTSCIRQSQSKVVDPKNWII